MIGKNEKDIIPALSFHNISKIILHWFNLTSNQNISLHTKMYKNPDSKKGKEIITLLYIELDPCLSSSTIVSNLIKFDLLL